MLSTERINRMSLEELKGYVLSQGELENKYKEIIKAKDDVIRSLQSLYNCQVALNNKENEMNVFKSVHTNLENEIINRIKKDNK